MGNELMPVSQIERQGFGTIETTNQSETASSAVIAREQATIQALFIMAERHPRDTEKFRQKLLHECKRPGFAEIASYCRKVGRKQDEKTKAWVDEYAYGPSIRLIEVALSLYRNVWQDTQTTYEDAGVRLSRTRLTDLENNVTFTADVVVNKVVEKRGKESRGEFTPPAGRIVVGEPRLNSDGKPTYLVLATDDEVRQKMAAEISKAIRKNGERMLPKDIIEEARNVAYATMDAADKADPDAAKRKLLDSFASIGVTAAAVEAYVGHSLDNLQPKELQTLRGIFTAVRDGNATWDEITDQRSSNADEAEKAKREAEEKLRGFRAPSGAPAAAPPAAPKDNSKQDAPAGDSPAAPEPEPSPEEGGLTPPEPRQKRGGFVGRS